MSLQLISIHGCANNKSTIFRYPLNEANISGVKLNNFKINIKNDLLNLNIINKQSQVLNFIKDFEFKKMPLQLTSIFGCFNKSSTISG